MPSKDEGHLELSYTTDRNTKWLSHSQKLFSSFLYNQIYIYSITQQFFGTYPNVGKIYVHLKSYMRMFIVFLVFTQM